MACTARGPRSCHAHKNWGVVIAGFGCHVRLRPLSGVRLEIWADSTVGSIDWSENGIGEVKMLLLGSCVNDKRRCPILRGLV